MKGRAPIESRRLLTVAALAMLCTATARATWYDASASLEAATELYTQSGLDEDRRPDQTSTLAGRVNLTLFGRIQLPFSFRLSSETSGYEHPFDQWSLGIRSASRQWRWVTVNAGFFSQNLSEFTLAGGEIQGGGVTLTPGDFQVVVASGLRQRAINPGTENREGRFRQFLTATQIGYENREGWLVRVTSLRAKDDDAGIIVDVTDDDLATPEENLVAGVEFGAPLGRGVRVSGEIAGSLFSPNSQDPTIEEETGFEVPGLVDAFFTPVLSTRADVASRLELGYAPNRRFGLSLGARRVGPGYTSLGAKQLEADVIEVRITPQVSLDNASASLGIGIRENNVAGTRSETTRRTTFNANVAVRPTRSLSVSASFLNFGLEAPSPNDTLEVKNVTRSFQLSPSWTFRAGSLNHSLSGSFAIQAFTDESAVKLGTVDSESFTASGAHNLSFPSGLTLTTAGTFTTNEAGGIATDVITLSESLAHAFFQRKLRARASISWSETRAQQNTSGINGSLSLGYRTGNLGRVELRTQARRFDVPGGTDNRTFTEVTTRLSYGIDLR